MRATIALVVAAFLPNSHTEAIEPTTWTHHTDHETFPRPRTRWWGNMSWSSRHSGVDICKRYMYACASARGIFFGLGRGSRVHVGPSTTQITIYYKVSKRVTVSNSTAKIHKNNHNHESHKNTTNKTIGTETHHEQATRNSSNRRIQRPWKTRDNNDEKQHFMMKPPTQQGRKTTKKNEMTLTQPGPSGRGCSDTTVTNK